MNLTRLLSVLALAGLCSVAFCSISLADVVVYQITGTPYVMILPEGKAKVMPGKSINYRIPTMGSLTLHTDTARVVKAPSRKYTFERMLAKAKTKEDAAAGLDAARFALQNGLLDQFYDAARLAWKIDPKNKTVRRLIAAQKTIKQPIGDAEATKKKLRDFIKRKGMKFEVSNHYVLMHDVPESTKTRGKSRAQVRLELLETVYKSYFLKFALENRPLKPPKERMMVLLFGKEKDYMHYVNLLDPKLKMASGFWSPKNNVAVYFDQGTSERHQTIRKAADDLNKAKDDIIRRRLRGGRDIIQFANALDKIVEISREQSDVSVVSHEATHQLAGNTGLLPRGEINLRWAHEGLATYFETPHGAGWGGIGAVNDDRLKWYRMLEKDREHSNIEFIVSDKIFDYSATHEGLVAGYGQAWALTHFLMETRFGDLVDYYGRITKVESDDDGNIDRDDLVAVFDDVFGDRRALESEWRTYMKDLKTDMERLMDSL